MSGPRLQAMRVIELRDECSGLEAFVVIDHDLFSVSAGGTRMLPDVEVQEVARLARAMTWKFAVCQVPYAGAKAGVRFAGGDRDAVIAAYSRALAPYHDVFETGPDMGTSPEDFLAGWEGPAIHLRAGEDIVTIGRVAHAGDDGTPFRQRGLRA